MSMPRSRSREVQLFDTRIEPEELRLRVAEAVDLLALGLLRRLQRDGTIPAQASLPAAAAPAAAGVSIPQPHEVAP